VSAAGYLKKAQVMVERVSTIGRLLVAAVAILPLLAGCSSIPDPGCAKHHCDPSIDAQFKRNASWDAQTPGEYEKLPHTH
jgi:hypothetical protein